MQEDQEKQVARLKKQLRDLEERSKKQQLALEEELDESNEARGELKKTIGQLEEKYIAMEEEVYEMQNT